MRLVDVADTVTVVHVAVAMVQAGSCNSDSTPGLGTSMCCRCGPIKKKKCIYWGQAAGEVKQSPFASKMQLEPEVATQTDNELLCARNFHCRYSSDNEA